MTTVGKILLGVGAALGLATVVYVTKKKDYTTVTPENSTEKKEDKSFKERIIEAAKEKAAKIVKWTFEHMDEIHATTTLVGLVSGIACLALRTKKLYSHDMELKMLEDIRDDTYDHGWTVGYNYLFDQLLKETASCAKEGKVFTIWSTEGDAMASYKLTLA